MPESFESLALDLEGQLGDAQGILETLKDVEVMFGQLRVSMDTANLRGREFQQVSWHEHHRNVRVLSELLHYLVSDLDENQQESRRLGATLLDRAREGAAI